MHHRRRSPQIRTDSAGPRRFRAIPFSRSKLAANRDRAAAACLRSSPVSNRTSTLVSTAIMAPNHLASNGGTHLRGRFRFAFGPQTAGDVVEIGFRETAGGTQQNSTPGFFHDELGARYPGTGSTDILGQDNLAFGGERGGFHWKDSRKIIARRMPQKKLALAKRRGFPSR